MFKKILIANRGEIAIRIMATCREMGIRTVAVYSDVDRNARHVRMADEAYAIGPAPAAQSYLQIETLLAVAQRSGAEAIHPGYGFLSENADFVEACERAGIIFIGPPAKAMRAMGAKISAKQIAHSVDAPTVPGYAGESQDETLLLSEAQRIGFPLLVKASAGGGGTGMREVHNANTFLEQLAGAKREAQASFGDDTVFLERLIQQPRHVEIQVLGDRHGNMIHLGERECSIQRRHQKIVEESPSVALTPALRAEMGATAIRIAQAAGYVNAGTMEFILDTDKHYYFLEMNTRLQVEHPVTELVTGLDLVRHQLLIAAGEPLALTQEQVSHRGHAIEVRIYAEDAKHNFLPSTGTIDTFTLPEGPGIRIDSGIENGDEITQFYDPMIAKLIVYGEDRNAAISRLQRALEQSALFGVTTNIPLLHMIALHPAFREGRTHTGFLSEHQLPIPSASHILPQNVLIAAGIYQATQELHLTDAWTTLSSHKQSSNTWKTLGPWRMIGEARRIVYRHQEQEHAIALMPASTANAWNVMVDGQAIGSVEYMPGNGGLLLLKQGEIQTRLYVHTKETGEVHVILDGSLYRLERRPPPDVDATAHGGSLVRSQKTLTAPMAGTIIKVQVHDGDTVEALQVLVILSAMKMEHAIIAPHEGKVRHVHYQEGAVVRGGTVIVELE
ncbi:MAG: acetyl-CoA carboxylase biotin carboxylase subunit [Ktedonobacteraceae bacterium]